MKDEYKPENEQLEDPVQDSVQDSVQDPTSPSADDFIKFDELDEAPQTLNKEVAKGIDPIKLPKQNTVIDQAYTKELDKLDERREHLDMPSTILEKISNLIENEPSINLASSEEGRVWLNTLIESFKLLRVNDNGLKALEDPDAQFVQAVEHESGALQPGIQRGRITGGATVSGEKAILGLRSSTGLGVIVRKPLWHSGIWLSIKSPTEPELIEVQRSLTSAKVDLGRSTWGLALSATTGLISEEYFGLIVDNFYNTSAKDKEDLLDLILVNDLPILQWQLACAVYPNGFQFSRACTSNLSKCNHVSKELINPLKLLVVNKAALTQEQKNHMSLKTAGSMDRESIDRYKNQHIKGQKRELKYNINGNEIKILLKIPTLREYFNSTHDWVDRLSDRVIDTLGIDASHKDRNAYINKLYQSTVLRQYAHYVESIDYGDIITDRETIYTALDTLSVEPDINVKFSEDVEKYINDTTIAIVGIPDYDCPKCKESQISEEDKTTPLTTNVIPIDPLVTFFTLHSQKLSRLNVVE
jgi:hypothetical protein